MVRKERGGLEMFHMHNMGLDSSTRGHTTGFPLMKINNLKNKHLETVVCCSFFFVQNKIMQNLQDNIDFVWADFLMFLFDGYGRTI